MSRSYKKHPRVKDEANKNMKRFANKKVRTNQDTFPSKGNSFKKIFESWNISDWNWRWSKEEAIKEWEAEESPNFGGIAWRHEEYKTLEKWLQHWEKSVKRK